MKVTKFNPEIFKRKEAELLRKIGEAMKQEMINRAPKETGMLAASIDYRIEGNTVTIGTIGVPYASYIEYFDWTGLPSAKFTAVEKPTPELPNDEWKALFNRGAIGLGQTIPFARSTAFYSENVIKEIFKEVFHK